MFAVAERWFAGDAALSQMRKLFEFDPSLAAEPDAGNALLVCAHARLMPARFAEGRCNVAAGMYPETEALMRHHRAEGK